MIYNRRPQEIEFHPFAEQYYILVGELAPKRQDFPVSLEYSELR